MSKIISEEGLKNIVESNEEVINGNIDDIEGIKYDFRFGSRFLKAHFIVPRNYEDLRSEELQYAYVDPGEVVFVLSKEKVNLPNNRFIQLSPKRSLAHDGIELLGGLTIDPNYEGYLVFGLYNVSGTPFKLKPGIKLVGANFCELSEEEIPKDMGKKPKSILDFPERLQDLIGKYKPVNPQNISDELKKLQMEFRDSQNKLDEDMRILKSNVSDMHTELINEISKREQESIRIGNQLSNVERKIESINDNNIKHEQVLISLKDNVKESRDDLKGEIKDIKSSIADVDKMFNSIKTWAKIIVAILSIGGAIIATVASGILEKIFEL